MEFNATFLISAISFILFTVIMNKIFYKPIGNIINERQKFIDDTLGNAKTFNEKADAILKDRDERIEKSNADAKRIIADKKNEANQNARDLTLKAKQESKDAITLAKEILAKEAQELNENINTDTLADVIVNKILAEVQ